MPVVEGAHRPRRWTDYRISREDFSALVGEVDRVVSAEVLESTAIEIEVAAYERPFADVEELLDNVEEREWVDLDEIGAVVKASSVGGLEVRISVDVGSGVRLILKGADRRARNAVEPDIVAAIEKQTGNLDPDVAGSRYVTPWYLLSTLVFAGCILGVVIQWVASGHGRLNSLALLLWLFGALFGSPALAGVGAATRAGIRRALPAAEFLPDSRTTRWSVWRNRWMRRARWTASATVFVATIAAAVTGVVALTQ
jgi:hypothetical protein